MHVPLALHSKICRGSINNLWNHMFLKIIVSYIKEMSKEHGLWRAKMSRLSKIFFHKCLNKTLGLVICGWLMIELCPLSYALRVTSLLTSFLGHNLDLTLIFQQVMPSGVTWTKFRTIFHRAIPWGVILTYFLHFLTTPSNNAE